MEDTINPSSPDVISTSSSSSCADQAEPTTTDAEPVHKVNIREVKQKTLALLTELYKTETGDVRRMAMTLLQTLYTIEEEDQVAEMNGKIQKLMKMIEEQKREQAEMEAEMAEEASLAASSHDGSIGGFFNYNNRSRAHTEESNLSGSENSNSNKQQQQQRLTTTTTSKDDADSSVALKENRLVKRWQEKLENMRKPETKTAADASTSDDESSSKTKTPPPPPSIQQWRDSVSTRMDASRERWANGWRESTTKLQQGLNNHNNNKQRNSNNNDMTVEAKPTEEDSSVSTEGSSTPPSPLGSETQSSQQEEEPKHDDLIKVFKNLVKDGIDSKQSRESLELAITVRREKARNRWAETRAKWKWNNPGAAQAQA